MLIACWSPKGGSGTTVIACGLAAVLARSGPSSRVLLVDLSGDATAVLGVAEPAGPGLAEWLAAGADVGAGALARLEVEATVGLGLLAWKPPAGPGWQPGPGRAEALVDALAAERRAVVVDCGAGTAGAGLAVAAGAQESLLVLRPCYLALRRALAAPVRPSGVILVVEPGRALGRRDVEDVLGVPVRAEVAVEEAVARAVDAGLLARRVPRPLERALRPIVSSVAMREAA
jgi:MinD superfamily P-loop ATPase